MVKEKTSYEEKNKKEERKIIFEEFPYKKEKNNKKIKNVIITILIIIILLVLFTFSSILNKYILYGNESNDYKLSLIHISEPTRLGMLSNAVLFEKK